MECVINFSGQLFTLSTWSYDHFIFGSFPAHWRGFVDKKKKRFSTAQLAARELCRSVHWYMCLLAGRTFPTCLENSWTSLESWPFHGKPKQELYYYSKQSVCTKTIKNKKIAVEKLLTSGLDKNTSCTVEFKLLTICTGYSAVQLGRNHVHEISKLNLHLKK